MQASKQPTVLSAPTLFQQILALAIRAFAIVIGIGALPLLNRSGENGGIGALFWLVGLAVGLLTIGVGVYLALPPADPASKRDRSAATAAALQQGKAAAQQTGAWFSRFAGLIGKQLTRLRPLLQRFTTTFQRLGQAIGTRLRRRPKSTTQGSPAPSVMPAKPVATPAPVATSNVAPPPVTAAPGVATATTAPTAPTAAAAQSAAPAVGQSVLNRPLAPPIHWSATLQALLTLLTPTVTIGVFVLLGALVALLLQRYEVARPGALAVYFSLPALLLWVIVEAMALYTNLIIRPKRLAQLAAISGSALQLLGALFLWIYLGLAVTLERLGGLYTLAAGLALLGVILAIVAVVAQQQTRRQVAGRLATA